MFMLMMIVRASCDNLEGRGRDEWGGEGWGCDGMGWDGMG